MKKYIRPILLALCGLALLLLAAALLFFTALRPLTVEAGGDLPAPAAYARYPFLLPTDAGEEAPDMAKPGEQTVKLSLFGIPRQTTLTVVDTLPPSAKPIAKAVFLGNTLPPEAFLGEISDATPVVVSFAEPLPDFTRPGEQTVTVSLCDAVGNETLLTARLSIYEIWDSFSVEAGVTAEALIEQIARSVEGEVLPDEDFDSFDSSIPGEHILPIRFNGEKIAVQLTVVDTVPPTARMMLVPLLLGQTLEADAFLVSVTDATNVKAEFAEEPDFSVGRRALPLLLTDAGGNTASVYGGVQVYDVPAEAEVEFGQYTAEELLRHLLGDTGLSADPTMLQSPTLGLTELPLTTPRGEHLTLRVNFVDTKPPVLYGVGDKTVYLGESVSYLRGVSAVDNRDGEVKVSVDSSAVNLRVAGRYPVTYSASDALGHETKKTVYFTVSAIDTAAVNAIADEVLSSILNDGMTELQRARAIFDWVTANLRYTAYADKSDAVAAAFYGFRNGRGDCFVYYAVSRFLLTRAGFENLEIHRDSKTNPHFWNLVKYEGNWYHFDACPHYAAHPLTCFLLTDSEVRHYSETRVPDYYSFDASLYPATP